MADNINVSEQALRETAQVIAQKNASMDQILNEINAKMQSLEGTWVSEAGTEIRANMAAMKPRFDQYKEVVDSYQKFLITTADTYVSTEQSLKGMAQAFK